MRSLTCSMERLRVILSCWQGNIFHFFSFTSFGTIDNENNVLKYLILINKTAIHLMGRFLFQKFGEKISHLSMSSDDSRKRPAICYWKYRALGQPSFIFFAGFSAGFSAPPTLWFSLRPSVSVWLGTGKTQEHKQSARRMENMLINVERRAISLAWSFLLCLISPLMPLERF